MKRKLVLGALMLFMALGVFAQQDKSKRASPPDSIHVTTTSGLTISINYSRPYLKGRKLGEEVAPIGKVWRTGANEATTVELNKDVTIEGKALKAGKYSLHSIPGEQTSTIIFNKVWKKSGLDYDEKEDVLRVDVPTEQNSQSVEQFTISASKDGRIELAWGNYKMGFTVK